MATKRATDGQRDTQATKVTLIHEGVDLWSLKKIRPLEKGGFKNARLFEEVAIAKARLLEDGPVTILHIGAPSAPDGGLKNRRTLGGSPIVPAGSDGSGTLRRDREIALSILLHAVAERVDELPNDVFERFTDRLVSDTATAVIDTILQQISEPNPEEDLGPFYSTAGLTRRLNCTRQALAGRVSRHTLLAVPSDTGHLLYPTFQFTTTGDRVVVAQGLPAVLKRLHAEGLTGIAAAAWLCATTPGLSRGSTAAGHLRSDGDVDEVLRLIDVDAERWAR